MSTAPLEIEGVVRGSELEVGGAYRKSEGEFEASERARQAWSIGGMAGRVVELTAGEAGSAVTTAALELVRQAQLEGEPAAWVCGVEGAFYPPDARRVGIDLGALPVVRLERSEQMGRAADRLVRSGGFGLLVLDLRGAPAHSGLAEGLQRRLLMHAEAEDVAVVLLTEQVGRGGSELGSTVSCRIEASRRRRGPVSSGDEDSGRDRDREGGRGDGLFECRLEALSDARFGPGWELREVVDGPPGLR